MVKFPSISRGGLASLVGLDVRGRHLRLRDDRAAGICYPAGDRAAVALSKDW